MKKIYNSATGEVEEEKKSLPTPEPILPLINSFCNAYHPCLEEIVADEVFTIARIREYFQCFTIPDPRWIDLLPKYLEALEERGFHMLPSFYGEPAIFVRCKKLTSIFSD